MSTDRTLTPAELARIDATVARVHAARADAGAMAARYDGVCKRLDELHDETVRLRRRAEGLEDQIADRDARIAELEGEVLHWRTEATDATRIMNRRGEHVRELKVRIAELEEKFQGTLARRCDIPGCSASHDAETGPPPEETTAERHWLRKSSPSLLLCPDHSHLWEGITPHAPRLDYGTRSCACTCGHPLPGPTLGHMGAAWIAHALAVLAATELTRHDQAHGLYDAAHCTDPDPHPPHTFADDTDLRHCTGTVTAPTHTNHKE